MQTPDNTERYMVTHRGSKMAIRLHDTRVFDTLCDAVEYANNHESKYGIRVFMVSNSKRPKEINDWRRPA